MIARAPTPVLENVRHAPDTLVAAWAPTVLAWCMRLGGRGLDAEDAAQEVLIRLLTDAGALRDPDALPAWLYQTTRRVIIDAERRAWLRRWLPGLVPDVADPAPDAPERLQLSEEARAVRVVLAEMPVELREVLVLCDMEERDGAEVARLLALPEGTVRSRLRRARLAFARAARRVGVASLVRAEAG